MKFTLGPNPFNMPTRTLTHDHPLGGQVRAYQKAVSVLSALNGMDFETAFTTICNAVHYSRRPEHPLILSVFRQLIWSVTSLIEEKVQKLFGKVY